MATGSGKTVVMAMIIAWQALNKKANSQDARFSDAFLIVTPGITIKDPAAVRKLAQVICRLPKMPRGVINCPADRGGGFVLVFSAPGERFHAVTLRSSGCQTVTGTGSGRPRWVVRTPLFWKQLAQVTGIASPAHTQA